MHRFRVVGRVAIGLFTLFALDSMAAAQPPRAPFALEPEGHLGEAVFPALEGWARNDDGTFTIVLGYFNRNDEPVHIPVGAENRIEPGGPDLGQPTHFLPGRGWGVFSITVPEDFGDQQFTWTLTINNQQSVVQFWLNPAYFLDPFLNRANGNVPPMLKVSETGDELQGPPHGVNATYTTTVGQPLELYAFATDTELTNPPPPRRRGGPRPPLTLKWDLYRGPTDGVMFDSGAEEGESNRHEFEGLGGGETTTVATFSEPGDYRLIVTANDISGNGGGGDQCCWTTAHVDVTVR